MMEIKEYRTVDKSKWQHGEWTDEPDKIQWPDPATGLPCLIVRNNGGALCGYVGVPDTHPWHGKEYGAQIGPCVMSCDAEHDYHYGHCIDSLIRVHGGLTFSGACAEGADESRYICHVPSPGEPDHVWWFGFDCAHSGDHCPGYDRYWSDGSYKSVAYVRREVAKLAEQLAAVKS